MPNVAPWLVLLLCVQGICNPVPPSVPPAQVIRGEYIVQLKPDLTLQDVLQRIPSARIGKEYHIGTLHFAVLKIQDELFDPSLDLGIDLVPNVVVEGYSGKEEPRRREARSSRKSEGAVCFQQKTGRKYWGLTRISHVDRPDYTDNHADFYRFDETAECVDIYVMDTGVNIDHETFGGRAYRGFTAAEILAAEGSEDRSGHGTHVAGLAAGRIHGVAKNANIISVKVFNETQSGSLSGILDGFDWISNQTTRNVAAGRKVKNVINMSWGFHDPVWRYEMLWAVIDSLPAVAVAAAGNRGIDACEFAPARFETVITVSGVDEEDKLVYDYGHCVDVLAPGMHIVSASHEDNTGEVEKSGTSMSAGYVTGIIARHLGSATGQLTTAEVRKILQRTSTRGRTDAGALGTPDLLAYASCESDKPVEGVPEKPLHKQFCGTAKPPGLAEIQAVLGPPRHLSASSRDAMPTGPQIRVMGYGSGLMDAQTISFVTIGGLLMLGALVVVAVVFRLRYKVHCDGEEDELPVVVAGEDTASVVSAPI